MATVAQPVDARPFEHLVLDFLAYLEFERGLSRNTLEAYRSDLLQYGRFLEERELTAAAATRRRRSRTSSPRWAARKGGAASPATIHRKAACLRSFYRHLRREGVLETDPTATRHGAAARPQAAPGAHPRGGGQAARRSPRAPSRPTCATARCSS